MIRKFIFIRHGQSEENLKFQHFCEGINGIKQKLKFPNTQQIQSSFQLLQNQLNSDLSELGKCQVMDMKRILEEAKFWEKVLLHPEDYCIICSPLIRAEMTLKGILPNVNEGFIPLQYNIHEFLREAKPHEYIFNFSLKHRQKQFIHWTQTIPKDQTIIAVGHAQYFKSLLGLTSHLIRNCDVWEAILQIKTIESLPKNKTKISSHIFTDVKLLFRTSLAGLHPWETIRNTSGIDDTDCPKDEPLNGANSEASKHMHTVDEDNEPTCRICLVTKSEDISRPLIRPCKCSGSLSFVHIECLNQWRATSTQAQCTCSVCQYAYRVQRTHLAEFVMSGRGALAMTFLLTLAVIFLVGMILSFTMDYLSSAFHFDIRENVPRIFFEFAGIDDWWNNCRLILNYERNTTGENTLGSQSVLENVIQLAEWKHWIGARLQSKHTMVEKSKVMNQLLTQDYRLASLIFCNDYTARLVNIAECGFIAAGLFGIIHFITQEVMRTVMRFQDHAQDQARGAGHMPRFVLVGISLFGMGNMAISRIAVFVGCAIAARQIYLVISVQGRRLGSWLGERILETNANAN